MHLKSIYVLLNPVPIYFSTSAFYRPRRFYSSAALPLLHIFQTRADAILFLKPVLHSAAVRGYIKAPTLKNPAFLTPAQKNALRAGYITGAQRPYPMKISFKYDLQQTDFPLYFFGFLLYAALTSGFSSAAHYSSLRFFFAHLFYDRSILKSSVGRLTE